MEYILENTNIFSEDIDTKFNEVIMISKDKFRKEKCYTFKASFHVNLLSDSRFQEFNVPDRRKGSKETEKDKVYDVLSFQLRRLVKILQANDIESYSTTIQGEDLEDENIIKIEINEDTSEPSFVGRGKSKKRYKISSIMPSRPYIEKTTAKLMGERMNELYHYLSKAIPDKRIMSEILEIDETEDDKKLFKAFVEQYGELWFTTDEREKELLDLFEKRCLSTIDRYVDEDGKIKLK